MGSIQDITESYDIVAVGAGLAGINLAYRLQTRLPGAKFTVLEAHDNIGGTWELFKYPGIRSDSDLHTYGFAWEPWPYDHPIAEGHLILEYLHACCDKYQLKRHMQFRSRVTVGDWDSERRRWTLTVESEGRKRTVEARFVVLTTGYYDYNEGLPVTIPGLDRFKGDVIHPQFWPKDYDFSQKEVVVIGSGATAITLIPSLAPRTKHVTMLQRSPTYIVSVTHHAPFSKGLWSVILPARAKLWLNWLYYATVPFYMVLMCQRFPQTARKALLKDVEERLPANVSTDPHFSPTYNPWEQRLCLSPGGDFFQALHGKDGKAAKASVVTAQIKTIEEDGVLCENGQELKADVLVTATGIKTQFAGGIQFRVNGEQIKPTEHVMWDGCMMNDVPNMMFALGYARASWTLGVDNTAITFVRLWKDMQSKGKEVAVPRFSRDSSKLGKEEKQYWLDLTSTYVQKDEAFPFNLKGGKGVWKSRGNVWLDWLHARFGNVEKALAIS